jgi:hypothetical protein
VHANVLQNCKIAKLKVPPSFIPSHSQSALGLAHRQSLLHLDQLSRRLLRNKQHSTIQELHKFHS